MIPLLTGIIGIATALTIVILIRRDRLHVRYGLWWMAAAVGFALMGLFPRVFDKIAAYLGVAYPPVLALTLGLVILVIKILVMDLERSKNAIKLNRLVQRIGLLESDIREMQGNEELAQQKGKPNEVQGD